MTDLLGQASVLVVAGHEVLGGVVERACREAGFAVVERVADTTMGIAACRAGAPDVLIVDLDVDDGEGLGFLSELGASRPPAVLVLADRTDDEIVLRSLQLGARGFVTKAEGLPDLGETVSRLVAGERAITPELQDGAIRALGRMARRARGYVVVAERLTTRQRQVLELLSEGLTVRQAASRLGLAPKTVETHVANLYARLGVRTRTQAVSMAATLGLVDL